MFLIGGILDRIQSRKDKTWALTFGTQELTPEQAGELAKLSQEYCFIAIKRNDFRPKELEIITSTQSEFDFAEKPAGQRLRAVLYRLWEQDKKGYEDFNLFYKFHMERIIEHLKNKLQ